MRKYIAILILALSTLACQLQAAPEPAKAGAVSAPVRQIADGQTGGIVIADEYLNMRNAPEGADWSFVIDRLPRGQAVTLLENAGEWCKISANNVPGWVLCRYVEWR